MELSKRSVTNRINKRVYGVGINDANYYTQRKVLNSDGTITYWKCPYYTTWRGMIQRAYSGNLKNNYPTYQNCTVCDEWIRFSNFKLWMETQDWEGLQLDKDLIFKGNKTYSPQTCAFIPAKINAFIVASSREQRTELPLGVYIFKPKYGHTKNIFRAQCCFSLNSTKKYLGSFDSPVVAHRVWQTQKVKDIYELVNWYAQKDYFNTKVAESLVSRAWKLLCDISREIETKSI